MTDTRYDHDNLPNNESLAVALPEALMPEAKTVIRALMDSEMLTAAEVRAGYVYERRGYMEFTPIGESPNLSYQSNTDDMIIQLTMRIPAPHTYTTVPEMQKAQELVTRVEEAKKEAERQRLEAEIVTQEERAEKALNAAKAKREELAKLNQK